MSVFGNSIYQVTEQPEDKLGLTANLELLD